MINLNNAILFSWFKTEFVTKSHNSRIRGGFFPIIISLLNAEKVAINFISYTAHATVDIYEV